LTLIGTERKCLRIMTTRNQCFHPVLSLFLLAITGCSSTKQTWRDWSARDAAPVRESQAVPATALPPVNLNTMIFAPHYQPGDAARVGPGFDLKMRNPDFPRTYIEAVYIDLSAPTNGVQIKWAGPGAADAPAGPWRFTPGRGAEGVDCDNAEDSNRFGSLCTPKGVFAVAGFADHLEQTPICRYATWVRHAPRYVAIHSHTDLPEAPASSGCIRVPYEAAKLIHNNSVAGVTVVSISGTWQRSVKTNLTVVHKQMRPEIR
jgi:hypothetical protein